MTDTAPADVPPGRWLKDTAHFNRPVTALCATTLIPSLEPAMGELFEEFGLPLLTIRQQTIGGEVYMQEIDLDGKNHTGSPPPWWVTAVLARAIPALRRRLKTAAAAMPTVYELPDMWESTLRRECEQRVRAALAIDLEALSDAELIDEFDRTVDELLGQNLRLHFRLGIPNAVGVQTLANCCQELLGWDLATTMNLLGGLSEASVAPVREMAEVSELIPVSIQRLGLPEILETDEGAALATWLGRWGDRSLSLDVGDPALRERPDLVLSLLRGVGESRDCELAARRREALDRAHAALRGGERERFDRALAFAQRVYPIREDNVIYTEGLTIGAIRRVALAIGTRLAKVGALDRAESVVHLERSEVADALRGSMSPEAAMETVRRRRAERGRAEADPGPLHHGPAPVAPPELRGMPKAALPLLGALMWSMEHELTPPTPAGERDTALAGVAAAPGRYRGRVRVVRSVNELDRLQPGEVLVSPTTDTNWGSFMSLAGALVIDGGGLLSHPAIIAREHGIPAVCSTGVATATLVDGQVVTVDGTNGTVQCEPDDVDRLLDRSNGEGAIT